MEWQKLDLTKASVVKREVDVVLQKLNEISNGASNMSDLARNNFLVSVQERIQEIENFYLLNTDDERAVLFEKERLRLRKAMQPFHTMKDTKSVAASDRSMSANASQRALDRTQLSTSVRTASQSQPQPVRPAPSPEMRNEFQYSMPPKSPPGQDKTIYSWENGRDKSVRNSYTVESFVYEPTSTVGFYSRNVESFDVDDMDKYNDFQIILTQEEMTVLAARKKSQKLDSKLHKSQAAALSVHASTPYVDPKRIASEMLRPGHPDRWIHY